MDQRERELLKRKIDQASLVSFDIFDTLLFRKTNTPETIFDLVGKHFQIHGFRKLRVDGQNEASRRTYAAHQYPHADMDEIYEVLAEHTEIPVDWSAVKAYEIQMERDALVANQELMEFARYAKEQGKRVVATSDMYLFAETLSEFLTANGFTEIDHVYCSADEHKAKFNRELFELVAQKENLPYEQILHIGDKERDDGEHPAAYGIQTFVYHRDIDPEKGKYAAGSDVDKGIYKILCHDRSEFWYNLGVEVGGPLYMGLYRYLLQKMTEQGRKVYFLSRDGYNLFHIFKDQGIENIEYLYTSRRALTMASITEMDQRDIDILPPYTHGQTVGELLDFLCVDRAKIRHLAETGLTSFDDVIQTDGDIAAFKKLYIYDKEVFLERCRVERDNAKRYFSKIGFPDQDAICFDCGWQGSSQELLEKFKAAAGIHVKNHFVYFGIKNGDKSRKQLHGLHYDAYLFDFYKNYELQADLHQNVALYELFFSAPHESVLYYDENGEVIFETGGSDREKGEILRGIRDYIREGFSFVEKYDVEYTPELAAGHLKRLIHLPTEEEAITIGNLRNVDGFARKQGEPQYFAYVTKEELERNPNREIYWMEGLLKRPDVSEDIKRMCAERMGFQYPQVPSVYHLEAEQDIRTYHRWLRARGAADHAVQNLCERPMFSVVIPVYNTVTEQLEECFQSVLAQTYDNYELILVDDHSSWENVRPVLNKYEAHDKVRVVYRNENGHISKATNDGIGIARGDFIVFMDCDDVIEPNALYEFAKKLNETPELDFIYSDEDKLTEDGKIRHFPFFKPDWSPDLFLSMMYTNHLAAYRTSIVKEIGGLRTAYNGSQDYDFTLRFMEHSDNRRVGHVAQILYHWRERRESVAFAMTSKNYASEAARQAKEDFIRRNQIPARMECITGMSQHRIVYEVEGEPLVSIVIPSKDHPALLKQCIDSIREFTQYAHYEIIVVDNGSSSVNYKEIKRYLDSVNAAYLYEPCEFNFSKMCNKGAAHAKGDYLLFLNDDIEVFQPDWLERMLGHAQQKHVGAVGAKLLYPQSTKIQHMGISNPVNGPLHSFMACDDQHPYYFGWNRVDYNCIGVTGACLLLAKSKFEAVRGFDETLPVSYNDVKLCFALHKLGYYNVMRNDVVAYHYESLSRGYDLVDDQKLLRLYQERERLFSEFPDLRERDPFLNEHMHHFAAELNLNHCCDKLVETDLSGCKKGGKACIDSILVGDTVLVTGWSLPGRQEQMEELERFLVVKDPFGKTYAAHVLSQSRADVAEAFGDARYVYSGFECALDRSALRVDVMPYLMGVMTVRRDGKRRVCWCKESAVIRNPRPRTMALGYKPLKGFLLRERTLEANWHFDECRYEGPYYKLRGFAYKRGADHSQYRKSLVLSDDAGNAYEFEVQQEERLDVACSFANEPFLYYTGFVCYIFESMLKPGQNYHVAIRLTHLADPSKICDIRTEETVFFPQKSEQ